MFKQLLLSDIEIDNSSESYRRLIMVNVVFIVAMSIYTGFTFINYFRGEYNIALLDFLFAIPTVYGYIELRRKKDIDRASTYAILLLFFTMLIVLFVFQAKEYTLLWSFLFAFIAMMLKGVKTGFRYIIIFYTVVYVSTFSWVGENLLMSEYIRFVAVSLVVIAVAYFYEKSITDAFDILNRTNDKLHDLNLNLEKNVQIGIKELRAKDELMIKTAKNAAMGEMIGAISHQWKQPLNALSITIQDIKYAQEYGELNDEYLEKFVYKSMNKIMFMLKTVDDFRDFLKPDKNKEEFFIRKAVDNVLNILDKQLVMNSIEVNVSSEEIKIYSFKGELEQVLLNFINNAKDALVEKKQGNREFNPEIFVDIKNIEDKNVITVSDNGDGIPEDNLSRIFNAHFSTKSIDNGTGIGLYISKMIVENSLKGTITAENRSEGGALFKVIF